MKKKIPVSVWKTIESESLEWVAQGFFSAETRTAILGLYEPPVSGERLRKIGMLTVLSLAVLLLGLSILLLVSYNWSKMTGTVKLSIVFGSMGLSYLCALAFRVKEHPVLAEVSFLLGSILYGAGIWQIGQIFHLPANYPTGFFLWAIGTFPLALALRTPILHIGSAILLFAWIFSQMVVFPHLLWDFAGSENSLLLTLGEFVPVLCLLLPPLAAVGYFSAAWGGKGHLAQETIRVFYAILFCFWLFYVPVALDLGYGVSYYFAAVGLLLNLLPRFLAFLRGRELQYAGKLFSAVGAVTLGIALAYFSFHEVWNDFLYERVASSLMQELTFGFILLPILLAFTWLAGASAFKGDFSFLCQNNLLLALGIFLPLASFFVLLQNECSSLLPTIAAREVTGLLLLGLQNIFMFCLGFFFIHLGLRNTSFTAFIFGVLYFLFWTILRYIDLFEESFGMLGASALFCFCALVLFAFSYYWFASKAGRKSVEETGNPPQIQV